MYFVTLPATITSGPNKDKPSTVDIKAAKLTGADGKNVQYTIAAERFSYPQFGPEPSFVTEGEGDKAHKVEVPLTDDQADEGIQEAIKDAGGKVKFLGNYNSATKNAALGAGKNYIRTKETGAMEDIEAQGIKLAREFTWATVERLSNKEVAQEAEKLAEEVDNLSLEELKARLKGMFKK